MDDNELTRKAIKELMYEMNGNASAQLETPLERKQNPIGKPNKRFLDRTITSVIKHNNRETVRTQVSSRRKLREMDDRDRKRAKNAFFNGGRHNYRDRYKSYKKRESRSRSNSRDHCRSKRSSSRKRMVKKKRKRNKREKNSRSSSSSSNSPARSCSSRSGHKKEEVNKMVTHKTQPPIDDRLFQSYFMQQSGATAFAAMALAYNQIHKAIRPENIGDQPEMVNNEQFSDLSLSSSLEESEDEHSDENGILTINVSSSGEDEVGDKNKLLSNTNLRRNNTNDSESSSSASCISVDSNDTDATEVSAKVIKSSEDIHVLSSSNSDDEVEIISVRDQNEEASFDLTKNRKYT